MLPRLACIITYRLFVPLALTAPILLQAPAAAITTTWVVVLANNSNIQVVVAAGWALHQVPLARVWACPGVGCG